ncbi:hypothetical protein FCL47_08615 [Desulfopila sp. IMCC35006]|uniref:CdaR family protein n=1 Tax=Desulfopila sp. IMCC35006 TaxID=2569542 RepID=UPI0010AC7D31|nr:CdaR family protein [Desulfopila sp. IMCC35006]TKB26468.1 hypothetical protein FCL47_08615 [Desulfopila sp. IMCC35006]
MNRKLRLILLKLRRVNLTNLVSKDWVLKFISLVLAVVLWYFVGGEDRVNKNVMIPIEIINLPRDLVISNQFKKEIEVTVSGPRSIIQEMSSRAITRQVDLSSATPGTMVIENDNDHIPVPRGITVQRVQPSSIILSLDKLIQKKFPVFAKTVGKVADGYFVKMLKMDPESITITGPLTTLSQVDELYTRPINLEGVKQSIQLQVPLALEPAIVELIGETSVTADLSIGMVTVKKILDGMEVHASVDGVKRDVRPRTVQVTANIPKKYLDKNLDPKSLLIVTAVAQESGGPLKVQVQPRAEVELPIDILAIVPSEVSLTDGKSHPVQKAVVTPKQTEEKKASPLPEEQIKSETPQPSAADIDESDDTGVLLRKVLKNQKNKRKLTE